MFIGFSLRPAVRFHCVCACVSCSLIPTYCNIYSDPGCIEEIGFSLQGLGEAELQAAEITARPFFLRQDVHMFIGRNTFKQSCFLW